MTTAIATLIYLADVFDLAARNGSSPDHYATRAELVRDLVTALEASPARCAPAPAFVHGLNLLLDYFADVGQGARADVLAESVVLAAMVVGDECGDADGSRTAASAIPIWEAFVAWHEEQAEILAGRAPVAGTQDVATYRSRRDVFAAELGHLRAFARDGR